MTGQETEILYKRTIGNKIYQWYAIIDKVVDYKYRLKYFYGEVDGTETITYSDICEPKNIGKKNETTSYQQATKELKSIYERQKKKGYKSWEDIAKDKTFDYPYNGWSGNKYEVLNKFLPKYNTDANNCIKPMKCQKFQIGKFNYPCIIQPKINGVRATIGYYKTDGSDLFEPAFKTIIRSKEGLEYKIKHIEDIFNRFYEKYPNYQDIIFDGELYIHSQVVTSIGGAARNPNNELHNKLSFVIFDLSIPILTNMERDKLRDKISTEFIRFNNVTKTNVHSQFINSSIIFLESDLCLSDEQSLSYMEDYIKDGFEGAVIRDFNAEYCFGQRPKTMMKLKKFDDSEFKVIDIYSKGNPDDKVGFTIIYKLQNDINDEIFECNGTGTVEEKVKILENKPIGKFATVKFYERTKNGIPFHANVIGIRDYE